ncbi:hypothetical protein TorRG33x02_270990 [Trema orientale]|uniref:Uncharacterized protein n=1 Tax=Trema orientale TaxID=63057 RepID=A0A2P5CWB4_TREOI|nr:hypothetical protein TorRG33x02_270990 [Trema orientale]
MALAQKVSAEEVVGPKTEPVKLHATEDMGRVEAHARFKPKTGSVIPARRRLVKTMMLEYMLKLGSASATAPKARNAGNRNSETGSSVLHDATRPDKPGRVRPYPAGNGQN